MREHEKRRPEHRGADGEMIIEVARGSAEDVAWQTVLIETGIAKAGVGELVVVSEIEGMLDERGASQSVVANAIPTDPGVQQRKR